MKRLLAGAGVCACCLGSAWASPRDFLKRAPEWFRSEEGQQVLTNLLSHQSDLGGWPKNLDTTQATFQGEWSKIAPTFDNGATTDELRLLAMAWQAAKKGTPREDTRPSTGEARYQEAFRKGFAYVLNAQYPTGGWPQYAPPPKKSYHRHITFNDGAMVRLMEFLRETTQGQDYDFLTPADRQRAQEAFDRGVQCILKCQVRVKGSLTVWCAQHDELDYSPRPARAFELASLSGAESVGIMRLLMSLERPTAEVAAAVEGAAAWFEKARIKGIRVETKEDARAPKGKNRVVVPAPTAPDLWARFYELETNRPIFVDRDGVPKYQLSEIGYERRNGYSWYGDWPRALLEKEYPAWKSRREKP